jgi:hypothetical protein
MPNYERLTKWPKPERGEARCTEIILEAAREGRIGFDCEFDPTTMVPTVFGVASKERCGACVWVPGVNSIVHLMVLCSKPISAFSCMGADKPVVDQALGIKTDRSLWSDPMIRWYLCNPDLSSAPKGTTGEEDGASLGLMSLWVATSMLHDIPNWKFCIGEEQCLRENRPCGHRLGYGDHINGHNILDYCAVDSWAGLVDDYALIEVQKDLEID